MAASNFEPSARSSSFSSCVEGKTYLWGGFNRELLEKKTSLEEFAAFVYVFDPYLETWITLSPGGSPPSGVDSGACACAGRYMYTYGGLGGSGSRDGSLHCLDTWTLMWTELARMGPMKKIYSGMIAYDHQLLLFGGHGAPSSPTQPGSEYIVNDGCIGGGWTNELHTFDLREGERLHSSIQGTYQLTHSAWYRSHTYCLSYSLHVHPNVKEAYR